MKENSIEKDEEILNNIKAYMQENIDKGYHKFVYNDLGYDEKCIDVINAIEHILSDYKRVLKENEELRAKWDKDTHILQNKLDYANADRIDLAQQNKELRKENEGLNNRCRNLDTEAQSYLEELMGDSTLKNRTIKQLNLELEKKDKIIDLMAEFISKFDLDESICKDIKCNNDVTKQDCINCIKKYFFDTKKNIF